MGESFTGYLFNLKTHRLRDDDDNDEHSSLILFFLSEEGTFIKCSYKYQPYLYVIAPEDCVGGVLGYLTKQYGQFVKQAEIVEKMDLEMINHLSGIKIQLVKLTFSTVSNLIIVRNELRVVVKENRKKQDIIDFELNLRFEKQEDYLSWILDVREDDVPYHVRVCIDNEIRCGKWYEVRHDQHFGCQLAVIADKLTKADLRVLAFDIETTKEPMKFPDPKIDSVMMISYMVDGVGYLITNREVISKDIEDFDYQPKPEFESNFKIFNERNERELLVKFAQHCQEMKPNIWVTYNGDYFDIPFIEERMRYYGMNLETELGLYNASISQDAEYMGRFAIHIDCLYWVKRDAFLPQGSHGLKAVTKAKLGYDPIEMDPEKMLYNAQHFPQQLCSYSVSDALATYYLYKLMIHDFILALCTIIPTYPDEILRKGSGTLCESLLMAQAYRWGIIFPNKQEEDFESFHNGHLIDNQTYVGGHVECLNVGVYRSDFLEKFVLDSTGYDYLETKIEDYLKFSTEIENGQRFEDLTNKQELVQTIKTSLQNIKHSLDSNGVVSSYPLIYHLDVSAMYPNIILTNRLQPTAIVNDRICSGCIHNSKENNCKRPMEWMWKGDVFPISRNEYDTLKKDFAQSLAKNKTSTGSVVENKAEFLKFIKTYSSKVYKQAHKKVKELRENTVCMRENSFYVDTVRDFRDRRYDFKRLVKVWKGKLEEALTENDFSKIEDAQNMMSLYDSLQLAHKIILNSFYGYVMRKGSRWFSMEMAAMVTYTGSNIIKESREMIERIGKPLELDTDGIWGMLPHGFPEEFKLEFSNGKKANFSFPCTMLNELIYTKYSNPQYQTYNSEVDDFNVHREMSIFFEVDGPYKCMVIPAAKEEGKMPKKRYIVFDHSNEIKELKGFELKRRGELKLVKIFQGDVFDYFLSGQTLEECYKACASIAEKWFSVLDERGVGMPDEELIEYIEDNKVMSKSIEEYGEQKSTAITCAKRLKDMIGANISTRGLCARFVISKKPIGAPVAERAVPVLALFDKRLKKPMLTKWTKDQSITEETDIRDIIDWDYYKERLGSTIMKIICIPAAFQKINNPFPKIVPPEWVGKLIKNQNKSQKSLKSFFKSVVVTKSTMPDEDFKPYEAKPKSKKSIFSEPTIKHEKKPELTLQEVTPKTHIKDDITDFIKQQKQYWNYLVKNGRNKRKTAPTGLFSSFDSKENAFRKGMITILSINESNYNPGIVDCWVVFDHYMEKVSINVKRKIIINTSEKEVDQAFIPVKAYLPRNKPSFNIFEAHMDEKVFQSEKVNFSDYLLNPIIEGIYETKVPVLFRTLMNLGNSIKLKPDVHFNNLSSHVFNDDDFEFRQLFEEQVYDNLKKIYIYQIHHKEKSLTVALNIHTKEAVVAFTMEKKTKIEIPNIKFLIEQKLEQISKDFPIDKVTFDFDITTFSTHSIETSLAKVNAFLLKGKKETKLNYMIFVQSSIDLKELKAKGLTIINEVPTMEFPTEQSDSNQFKSLTWLKSVLETFAYRFLEIDSVYEKRKDMSAYTQYPICRLPCQNDLEYIDLIFARTLTFNRHVLWFSPSENPDLGQITSEKQLNGLDFTENSVTVPGFYNGYSVNINMSLFAINAILNFEHLNDITGTYDNNLLEITKYDNHFETLRAYNKERDEYILCNKSFSLLKKLVEKWFRDCQRENSSAADLLLTNFFRWVNNKESGLYDPVFLSLVDKIVNKMFVVLVKTIDKHGFKVIYADYNRLLIHSKNTKVEEFKHNFDNLFTVIKKQNVFSYIAFVPTEYYCCMLYYDNFNYSSFKLDSLEDVSCIEKVYKWNIADFLPAIARDEFIYIINEYVRIIYELFFNENFELIKGIITQLNYKDVKVEGLKKIFFSKYGVKDIKKDIINDYFSFVINDTVSIFKKKLDFHFEHNDV